MKSGMTFFIKICLLLCTNLIQSQNSSITSKLPLLHQDVQNVINESKDFEDLLLFIGVLDSQDIPQNLLYTYKSKYIVDTLINHLKERSLITNYISCSEAGTTFSIDCETQKIIALHFTTIINEQNNSKILQEFSNALENYIEDEKNKNNYAAMRLLTNHCEKILKNNVFNDAIKASLKIHLGDIYCYLGKFIKAKSYLENSCIFFDRFPDNSKLAWALAKLGHVNKELTYLEEARDSLEKSLIIYKKHFPKDYNKIAWAVNHLGNVYRDLDEFERAKIALLEGLTIYQKYIPNNYTDIIWNLLFLGYVCNDLGDYENAKNYFIQARDVCHKNLPEDHIHHAWALGNLGNIYRELKNYKDAEQCLLQSLIICEKNLLKDHIHIAWILRYLGILYFDIKDYGKAKELLEKALLICKIHVSENHARTVLTSLYLAHAYGALGEYEKAKDLLEKNIAILEEHFPKKIIYFALYSIILGDLYVAQGDYIKAKNLFKESLIMHENYYGKNHIKTKQALEKLTQCPNL